MGVFIIGVLTMTGLIGVIVRTMTIESTAEKHRGEQVREPHTNGSGIVIQAEPRQAA
jgi:hypothetical protein